MINFGNIHLAYVILARGHLLHYLFQTEVLYIYTLNCKVSSNLFAVIVIADTRKIDDMKYEACC